MMRVRAAIVVNVTLEPILMRLADNSAVMNRLLSYYGANIQQFVEVAGICEANVRTMRRRLGYVRGRFLREILRSLRAFKRDRTQINAQEVYACLQQVRQHIANMLEEKRITG